MSLILDGSNGITFPNSSTQAVGFYGFKNRIIDGGFIINQRVYTSGTSLSAGSYGHDRWKAGSGGGTYTFTQGSLGVNTTVTITAGTLVQVIEGCNLAEGGTYVLSWTGTAQGRLNGGTYGSSGTVTVTGWTAGANLSVEFNTGTLGSVQLEAGSTATSFDYRPYGTELSLCQRYFQYLAGSTVAGDQYIASGMCNTSVQARFPYVLPVQMRVGPGVTFPSASNFVVYSGTATPTATALTTAGTSDPRFFAISATVASGLSAGYGAILLGENTTSSAIQLSAEL
jgi:hypothetical protein